MGEVWCGVGVHGESPLTSVRAFTPTSRREEEERFGRHLGARRRRGSSWGALDRGRMGAMATETTIRATFRRWTT